MRTLLSVVAFTALVAGVVACQGQTAPTQAPKKLLVVSVTTGFRHTSIPTLEKVLAQLGKDSGEFTVDYVQQPSGAGRPPGNGATQEQRDAYAEGQKNFRLALTNELKKLAPENLKNYDGIVFASTTGDLPIPDPQGLLDWIKAGHAFIGIHAASDTFHHWPEYLDMLGAEFDHHGAQLDIDCLNQDPQNPATASVPNVWKIAQEEVYQFKKYDPAKVHDLLILDKRPQEPRTPGHYAVAWCKPYSSGRVFYTSLGHREDLIDADPNMENRKNSVELSKTYQAHLLGGIEWALGLKK
jgi:type 1 glutamine amidotransferase